MVTRRLATLGLLVGMALPAITLRAPSAQAAGKEARERVARKACLSGDYAKGVEILSDLFIDMRDASYIFNQGRCFEQNGRCEDAVARFREYLRKASNATPEKRADTEKHIAECQTVLGAKPAPDGGHESASAATPSTPASLPTDTTPAPLPAAEASRMTSTGLPAAQPGRGLRLGGLASGIVGLAAIAGISARGEF